MPAPVALTAFTEPDGCDWCDTTGPTARIVIDPGEVRNQRIIRRPIHAYACRRCSNQIGLNPRWNGTAAEQVKFRKALLAETRARRRKDMRDSQGYLFDERAPANAITEG